MITRQKIRVLVADDSGFVRELIREMLADEPDIQIVGEACNGQDAVEKTAALKPDIVTMDIEMPVLGGLEAIEKIMVTNPVPILVITALTGVRTAFAAVSKGALDVIEKPDISQESSKLLVTKIRKLSKVDINAHLASRGKTAVANGAARASGSGLSVEHKHDLIAIAASTGGPQAIYSILSGLPADLPNSILITQHIAAGFTKGMVDWLAEGTKLKVKTAASGDLVQPGHVYVNPAENSMTLVGKNLLLGTHPVNTVFRPCCNTMLNSVARHCGKNAIGIILSGMGNDGVDGIGAIKSAGGITIAQSSASSVIHGMNKLAVDKGYVKQVLSPPEIAAMIADLANKRG
ncbi:MAG: chemotaxis-specific protein-glutamate methyltransferase CheB [Trichlorobacter sp.]|jgi:two-component system chemotaxis response regulator CheB|nr:chemotaxis-specific protein-glutamate methyltransferase CheB [Trichlorobacter sp.]